MRIEIEIPKEFERHFAEDRFKDSLERIMADIKHSLRNGDCLCSGRYELETIEMLSNAFEKSRPVYKIQEEKDTSAESLIGKRYLDKQRLPGALKGIRGLKGGRDGKKMQNFR